MDRKSIEKASKTGPKTDKILKKYRDDLKMYKNRRGEPTFRPEGGLGSILGSLEKPKNEHYGKKMRDWKKEIKKSWGRLPRRVSWRAVRKVWMDGQAGI